MLDWKLHNVFQNRSRKDSDSSYWQGTFTEHMLTCTRLFFAMQVGADCSCVGLREWLTNVTEANYRLRDFQDVRISVILTLQYNSCSRLLSCWSDLRWGVLITRSFQLERSTSGANYREIEQENVRSSGLFTFSFVVMEPVRVVCVHLQQILLMLYWLYIQTIHVDKHV